MEIEIKNAEIIRAQDGDVIVVSVKGYAHAPELERVKEELTKLFLPKSVKVVIVNGEILELKVMRAE